MPPPPSPIGFDASVLINFCAVLRLDLLIASCDAPRYALTEVLEELDADCRAQIAPLLAQGEFLEASIEGEAELMRWAEYTLRLDAGESATLAAAAERGWSIAVDEQAARRLAERDLGSGRMTGTVGLLLAAVEQGHLTLGEGDRLLAQMIAVGYWAPVQSLRELSS